MANASATEIANFINEFAPCAQNAYKVLGKVKPSVCIGMACVESGFGTSKLMYNHHAVMGHKVGTGRTAKKYWNGTFFTATTKEEYQVGVHTVITDAFRSYTDLRQCALNFYELLNTSLYARVKSDMDYKAQMQAIKACGYMTSSTEVNSVLNIINTYGLLKYDSVVSSGNVAVPVVTNPYKRTATLMKKGTRNESVKWLQFELNKHGYNLAVDGIYGTKTYNAVISFQKSYGKGILVDGIVGKQTISALENS